MEDILEVYHRSRNPIPLLLCPDEPIKQLTKEIRLPIPARPEQWEASEPHYNTQSRQLTQDEHFATFCSCSLKNVKSKF